MCDGQVRGVYEWMMEPFRRSGSRHDGRRIDPFWDLSIWVNYNDLTSRSSPGIMVSKGNHPQMALIQVSELL